MTQDADIDKYGYSDYRIEFDRRSNLSFPGVGFGQNVLIFGVFFCLSLHYNGANNYLFVNDTDIYKFKTKDCEIVATPLCLGNISKDLSVDNIKKVMFTGYVYDFSVDYESIAVDDIKAVISIWSRKMI